MKRLLPLFFILFLCASLSACGESNDKMTISSMRNKDTGAIISLGMSKTAVEDLLGEGTNFDFADLIKDNDPEAVVVGRDGYQDTIYGAAENQIMITYKNDVVVGISASAKEEGGSSNWSDKSGLAYGSSTREEMFEHYGEKEATFPGAFGEGVAENGVDYKDYYVYEYYFDALGNEKDEYSNCSYMLLISLDNSNGRIVSIGVSDATQETSP